MSLTIGVDVGGTKVAAGVVDAHGRIVEKLKRPTPSASPQRTAQVIADTVIALLGRHTAEAVGIGAAGFVDAVRSRIPFAPNLAWRDEPLKQQVEKYVGLPVVVENDANAAAWAETILGAARGHEHVILVAVGTGIGAGIVINGQVYRGRWGMAGEPGHYQVVPDGRLCGCGNRGCWEQYASGSALVAEAREFARRSPGPAVRLLQLGGGVAEGIGGPEVTRAASEGDAAALRCFEIVGGWLGQGLATLAAILDPGCFVIGGGVSEAGDLLIRPARAAFAGALTGGPHRPHAEIRLAELGADAGLIGAADLARRALAGDTPAAKAPSAAGAATAAEVHSTAPLSGPAPRDGPSPRRSTSTTKPPTNAAIATSAAQPGTAQPASVATSRYAGPPNSAVQAPLATESRCGSGGGGGGT
jgi:glucokinase